MWTSDFMCIDLNWKCLFWWHIRTKWHIPNLNVRIEAAIFLVIPSFVYVTLSYTLHLSPLRWLGSALIRCFPHSLWTSVVTQAPLLPRIMFPCFSSVILYQVTGLFWHRIHTWPSEESLSDWKCKSSVCTRIKTQSQNTLFAPNAQDGTSRVVCFQWRTT